MHPLPDHEVIDLAAGNKENQRVLNRLKRNDPALKKLTFVMSSHTSASTRQIHLAFEAIETHTSLEILNIEGDQGDLTRSFRIDETDQVGGAHSHNASVPNLSLKSRVFRALRFNTSLKHIRVATPDRLEGVLVSMMASTNIETLTVRKNAPSIEDIRAMAQVLYVDTKLHSLTIEEFHMDSEQGAALAAAFHGRNRGIKTLVLRHNAITRDGAVSFAAAFQGNQTIKTLIMRDRAIDASGAVSFVEALPRDHSLEAIFFDENGFDDDSVVSIVRTLCHTPLKSLSLMGNEITQDGCERIVQVLRENEHNFTKLDLFRDSQHSQWQKAIRAWIDFLIWVRHFGHVSVEQLNPRRTRLRSLEMDQQGGQRTVFQGTEYAFLSDK